MAVNGGPVDAQANRECGRLAAGTIKGVVSLQRVADASTELGIYGAGFKQGLADVHRLAVANEVQGDGLRAKTKKIRNARYCYLNGGEGCVRQRRALTPCLQD